MESIQLIGTEKKEIIGAASKGIVFKKIKIHGEDCSFFLLYYEVINEINGDKFSSPIDCSVSPYQRDVSQVALNKSILIPEYCKLFVYISPILKTPFEGTSSVYFNFFLSTKKLVFVSERDRQNAYRVALTNIARFYNVLEYEYKDNESLYNEIKQLNLPIVSLLKDYFKAYNEWFEFYERIKEIEENSGLRYDLTELQKQELALLIANRENTLNSLQIKFDELQFEKFKKSQGLENIDGMIL